MNKDRIGNRIASFATLGASNHSKGEREVNDYYATEPVYTSSNDKCEVGE